MRTSDAFRWYDAHVGEVADAYEAVRPEVLHAWITPRLPPRGARALDVGAGTGRDAAWLARHGLVVVAVEPSRAMRKRARRLHAEAPVRWLDDSLPALARVRALGVEFDLVLMSAVWMHVAPDERPRAFEALASLLAPGGLIAMTLRFGPPGASRLMHPVSADEVRQLADAHGLSVDHRADATDQQGRADVTWQQLGVRRPMRSNG